MPSQFETDCVIAGAGVIGLAIARALARAGREVVVVERAKRIGSETSARNSEVVHAGLYYPEGSLKAEACVAGKEQLYDYLSQRHIPYRQCEKLIVATTPADTSRLEDIARLAAANGVEDLVLLDASRARALEPEISAEAALRSPSTGILDSHAYMLSLLGEAEDHGAVLALGQTIVAGEARADGRIDLFCDGADPCRLRANIFVNAAGLWAPALANRMEGFPQDQVPGQYFAKGNYFALSGPAPFTRLIYPVPSGGGLGVHLTFDLAGQARFGPDMEWVERIDYRVNEGRIALFYDAVRKYWKGLADGALQPAYSGIRPRISGPDEPPADFVISGTVDHGLAGQIHLFGIESPGLTASLDLAQRVSALVT
ncbi:MAG: NAD(P)/FAD-dependent oxidoreductase [Pseudomonadota bacterium]